MSINKKILGFLVIVFFFVSGSLTYNSINSLKKSQTNNLYLFKAEFLELGRELFDNSSNLFFDSLSSEIENAALGYPLAQTITDFTNKKKAKNEDVIVFDIASNQFLKDYANSSAIAFSDQQNIQTSIEIYLQENKLNQKTNFDLDNFSEFSADTTNTIIPKKVHFHIYNDAGLVVGFGQDFLSGKIRIEFIERQNKIFFASQLYLSLIIFIIILILTSIFIIIFMKKIILNPLEKVVEVVRLITGGDLNQRVVIKSKDEIGQLGLAFNEMTSKLKESQEVLELKIESRTKELETERGSLEKKVSKRTLELENLKNNLEKTVNERTKDLNDKLLELEKMNDLMLGRELKMIELKTEIKKLKSK